MTLKEARRERGYTLKELSQLSGVHSVQIAKVEGGATHIGNMTARNFMNLCDALHVDPHDLLPAEKQDRRGGAQI